MPNTTNKTALITGASSGLGAEFSNQLAARGYNLVLSARRADRLEELAASLFSHYGVNVTVLPADLSVMEDITRVTDVISNLPDLELLINNAGFSFRGRFYRVEAEKELVMMRVHMIAPVMFCRAALPGMISRNSGGIINVASVAGFVPTRIILYDTSKNFLIRFTQALHAELRKTQVKVQALCPGFVHTELVDLPEFDHLTNRIPGFLWLTAQQVVSDSLASFSRDNVICVPGNVYKLVVTLARSSFTAGFITWISKFVFRRKKR